MSAPETKIDRYAGEILIIFLIGFWPTFSFVAWLASR